VGIEAAVKRNAGTIIGGRMDMKSFEYRGFHIVVTPMKDHEGLWDFKYQISKPNDPAVALTGHSVTRRQTLIGYESADIACDAGIEVAKTEIDNYIAMSEK
jgi:hypothetical protein